MSSLREGRGGDTLFPQYITDAFAQAAGPNAAPPTPPPDEILFNDIVGTWGAFWQEPIADDAVYTPFTVTGDSEPGFVADNGVVFDLNYEWYVTSSDPTVTFYEPGGWTNRSSGTTVKGAVLLRPEYILPDTFGVNTPNNATIIYNQSDGSFVALNAACRPIPGGSLWGYTSGDPNAQLSHGGSGTIGGNIREEELLAGEILHAIAINVWGEKYLSSAGVGFVSPATKTDTGYDDPESGNYYGGDVEELVMGTKLAIPPDVTAESLGITSPIMLIVYQALVTYGAYIVDNTAWDALAFNTDTGASIILSAYQTEMQACFQALELVTE